MSAGETDSHLERMIECASKEEFSLCRAAVVVEHPNWSATAHCLRQTVPTYAVATLEELRAAFRAAMADDAREALFAIDLTKLSDEDTELFGQNLASTPNGCGTVYLMTPSQFRFFEDTHFDFVVR